MNKKLFFIIIFSFIIIPLVTSQEDVFLKGDVVDLKITCLGSTGYCSSGAACNASIIYPNNTYVASNVLFQNQIFVHNYTLEGNISGTTGTYTVNGFCKDGAFIQEIDFDFVVSSTGSILTTGESIVYFLLAIFSFVMFIGMSWFGVGLPFQNPRNDLNKVIGIERLKYAKLGAITLSYAFFVWFINLMFVLSSNLVSLTQFTGFFEMLFTILMDLVWPFFVIMFIIFFITAARDLKLKDLLNRGINPR